MNHANTVVIAVDSAESPALDRPLSIQTNHDNRPGPGHAFAPSVAAASSAVNGTECEKWDSHAGTRRYDSALMADAVRSSRACSLCATIFPILPRRDGCLRTPPLPRARLYLEFLSLSRLFPAVFHLHPSERQTKLMESMRESQATHDSYFRMRK